MAHSAGSKEVIRFEPHPSAITNAGDYAYHASGGRAPLPYAIGEFVDNSLSATKDNTSFGYDRKITITFSRESLGHGVYEDVLCIWDNGCGMHLQQMKEFATYGLDPKRRGLRENIPSNYSEQEELFLNSRISQFGVGSKQAAFFIGDRFLLMTKPGDRQTVSELYMSKEELNARWDERKNVYEDEVLYRTLGDYPQSRLNQVGFRGKWIRDHIAQEKNFEHFTSVIIGGIRESHVKSLLNNCDEICQDICHVYHYYLHGTRGFRGGNLKKNASNVDIRLEVIENGHLKHSKNLSTFDQDLESRYLKKQVSEFDFRLEKTDDRDQSKTLIVRGRLFFFPFKYDQETVPLHWSQSHVIDTGDDYEEEVHEIFECFWQGRLIPYTQVAPLKFMEYFQKQPIFKNRVRGMLFFSDAFSVTQNKLTFVDDLHSVLNRFTPIFEHVTLELPRSRAIAETFSEWVRKCHSMFDVEVQFQNRLPAEDDEKYEAYSQIVLPSKVVRKDDLVIIRKNKEVIFASVLYFASLKDELRQSYYKSFKSLIWFNRLPQEAYGTGKHSADLSYLDKEITRDEIMQEYSQSNAKEMSKVPEQLEITFDAENNPYTSEARAGYVFPGAYVQVLGHIYRGKRLALSKLVGEKNKAAKLVVSQLFEKRNVRGKFEPVDEKKLSSQPWEDKKHYFYDKALTEVGIYKITYAVEGFPKALQSFTVRILPGPPASICASPDEVKAQLGSVTNCNIHLTILDQYGNQILQNLDLSRVVLESELVDFSNVEIDYEQLVIKSFVASPTGEDSSSRRRIESVNALVRIGEYSTKLRMTFETGPPTVMILSSGKDIFTFPTLQNQEQVPSFKVSFLDAAGNAMIPEDHVDSVQCSLSGISGTLTLNKDAFVTEPVALDGTAHFQGLHISIDPKYFRKKAQVSAQLVFKAFKSNKPIKKLPELVQKISIIPGNRPAFLQLQFHNVASKKTREGYSIQCPVETSVRIHALLFNEGGEEIVPPFIDESIRSGYLEGDWFPGALKLGELFNMELPPIENHGVAGTKYFQLSLVVSGVTLKEKISITATPLEPVRLRVRMPKAYQCGTPFGDELKINFEDKFKNATTLPEDAFINGTCRLLLELDSDCQKTGEWVFEAVGDEIRIPNGSICAPTGKKKSILYDPKDAYQGYAFKFEVLPGKPDHLQFMLSGDTVFHRDLTMDSETRSLISGLSVELCDISGNICDEESGITVRLESQRKDVYLGDSLTSVTSGSKKNHMEFRLDEGKANTGNFFVNASELELFPSEIDLRITCSIRVVQDAFLRLKVVPLAERVKRIDLKLVDGASKEIRIGESFPSFQCSLLGENGSPLSLEDKLGCLTLYMTDDKGIPVRDVYNKEWAILGTTLKISSDNHTAANSGLYSISLRYEEKRPEVCVYLSHEERTLIVNSNIAVSSGNPVRLGFVSLLSDTEVSIPPKQVSFSPDHREVWTLASDLCVMAFDRLGNSVRKAFSSRNDVQVRIRHNGQESVADILPGHEVLVAEEGSKLRFQNLRILSLYDTNFEVLFNCVKTGEENIDPCGYHVHVSKDSASTEQYNKLSQLLMETSKRLENITDVVEDRQAQINSISKEIESLPRDLDNLVRNVPELRRQSANLSDIDTLFNLVQEEISDLQQRERKKSHGTSVVFQPGRSNLGDDVRRYNGGWGLVGQLAIAPSVEISRVIAWQLGRKMVIPVVDSENCEAGQWCKRKDHSKMCLDLIHPMPAKIPSEDMEIPRHITEVPRLAYTLLQPAPMLEREGKTEVFEKVFMNLLRNLIVMETYSQAYEYKKWLARIRRSCPTIITLDGQMINSNGITGGRSNRCPNDLEYLFTVEDGEKNRNSHIQVAAYQRIADCIESLRHSRQLLHENQSELEKLQSEERQVKKEFENLLKEMKQLNPSYTYHGTSTFARRRRSSSSIYEHRPSVQSRTEDRPYKKSRYDGY